jgi:glycosyltransferase involved in cell wall biosynthesis
VSSVSVLIPCYNYGHFLPAAVSSALEDQGDVDVRVLIIDDASPDGSGEVAREIAAEDPRVEALVHPVNRGHIVTYNEGLLDWADGDYCVLLSADDLLTPGALERAAAFLDAHPQAGFVYGNPILFQDGDPLPQARTRTRRTSLWPGHTWLEHRFRQAESGISCPEVMVRTSLQRKVGGYNPELPHLGDTEMWLRLAANADVGYLHGVDQAYYRRHARNMSTGYTALPILQQYRLVYDNVLDLYGDELPDASHLSDIARKKLASDALWAAARSFDRGLAQDSEVHELVAYAFETWPEAAALPAHRALQLRRAIGRRAMPYLRPLVLPGVVARKVRGRWEKRGLGFRRNRLRWISWA